MITTTIEEVLRLAQKWQLEGASWHFHMLTPDCMFNQCENGQAFILENRSSSETYVVHSKQRYMAEGKQLVQLLHGDKIVSEEPVDSTQKNSKVQTMLSRAKSLNQRGIHWHHHMLFPDCIFNKHAGLWNLVFEDPESGQLLESTSLHEPTEELRAIEVLYYAQAS